MKEQPFYIGQKVVALINLKEIIANNVYTVNNVFMCSCGKWYITVMEMPSESGQTFICSNKPCEKDNGRKGYKGGYASSFAPIEEGFQSISFTKIMEEELTSVN